MKAVNNYIIVQNIKTEPKKVAGLIMTEELDDDNRYIKAEVISAGNLVEGIKDKDIVYYDKGIYQLQDQTKCLQLPNKWTPVATRYLGIFTNFHTNGGTFHHLKQQYTNIIC